MDSSSDGSFAWTDASNDTIDSGAMVCDNMDKIQSEDESVSGKSYKKKLQEELFAQSNRVAVNVNQVKAKKLKRKLSEGKSESGESERASPKKKKIKREPESDMEVSATGHKTNGHNHSESHDSYDESYLDSRVKAEKEFASPLVKIKKKKKKSKKRKSSTSDETNHQVSLLEGAVATEHGSGSPTQYAEEPEPDAATQGGTVERVTKRKNKKSSKGDPDDCRVRDTEGEKQQPDPPASTGVSFNTLSESVNRSQRISERIQFEEDESSEMETSQLQSTKPSTKSSKLKSLLKNNINLKPFTSRLKSECVLTAYDEVWVIRCPKDVDIDAFQNKDLMLQGKCKLKLNGQTYEGIMDDESGNMSVLSSEQSNFAIKSVPVKGLLNLRKRIPKSHIHDEATVGNQTNFIPLPETKSRHPLFGSNYRKAIKLPASVAERLRAPISTPALPLPTSRRTCRESNMQHHHHLLSTPKAEPNPESSVKPELETSQLVNSKKKKKKRKHSDNEEIAPKKKKRMKHDLESSEAWESEQAIEENLFNF